MAPERKGSQNKFALHRTVRTPYDRAGTKNYGSNSHNDGAKPSASGSTLGSISRSVMRAFGTLWHPSTHSNVDASISEPTIDIGHSFTHNPRHTVAVGSVNGSVNGSVSASTWASASMANDSVDLSAKQRKILAYRNALKQMAPKRRRSDISDTTEDARGEQTQDITALSVAAHPRISSARHRHEPSDVGQATITETTDTTIGDTTSRNAASPLLPPTKVAKHGQGEDTATGTSPRKSQWKPRSFNSRLGASEPSRVERRLKLVTKPLVDLDKIVAHGDNLKGLYSANFDFSDESDDDGPPTPKASVRSSSLSRRPAIESSRVGEQRKIGAAAPNTAVNTSLSSSPAFQTTIPNPPQYSFHEPEKQPAATPLKSDAPVFSFKPAEKQPAITDKPAPSLSSGFNFGAPLPKKDTAEAKPALNFGSATAADNSADKPAEKPAEKPSFQFGSGDKPSFSFSASTSEPAKPEPAKPAPAKAEEPTKPSFSFGAAASAPEPAKPLFGVAAPAKPLFGAEKQEEKKPEDKPAFSFSAGQSTPGFSFGSSAPSKPETEAAPKPAGSFQFGKPDAPSTPTTASSGFQFGKPAEPAKPTESTSTVTDKPAGGFQFGKPAESRETTPSAGFTFGKPAEPEKKESTFGAKEDKPAATPFTFGKPAGDAKPAGFQFGAPAASTPAAATPAAAAPAAAATPAATTPFTFGASGAGSSTAAAGTPSTGTSGFQFGAAAPVESSNKRPLFGASEPAAAKPAFQFGSSAAPAAAPATGAAAAKPFAFGANSGAPPAAGFSFGSNGSAANGFGQAGPTGQAPAAKPNLMFGSSAVGASASPSPQPETPTAGGFGFGQNGNGFGASAQPGGFGFGASASGPSTPAAANGFAFGSNPGATTNSFGSGAGPAANNPFAAGLGAGQPGNRVSSTNGRPIASVRRRMR